MKNIFLPCLCLFLLFCLCGCGVEYPESNESLLDAALEEGAEEAEQAGYNFLFISDTAKASSGNYSGLKNMMDLAVQELPEISFILHGGDVVNSSQDESDWASYWDAMAAVKDIPTYVSWGEKDGQQLSSYYTLPENGPSDLLHHFYSFSYENAHFIFLDSAYMGLQRPEYVNWLRNDLTNSGREWNILVCHYPLYPAADLSNDVERAQAQRSIWDSSLKELGIDLVLSGHQHLYMRSKPVSGGELSPDGPIHIQVNSGGLYTIQVSDFPYIEQSYVTESNFCHFNISGKTLNMTAYDEAMQPIDSLTLTKDAAPTD
ncbi:MAG: metallophosphoesterase, partial [Bacillota bacterium]|nr:metallophosphoesterase [Bacillota bacterium]